MVAARGWHGMSASRIVTARVAACAPMPGSCVPAGSLTRSPRCLLSSLALLCGPPGADSPLLVAGLLKGRRIVVRDERRRLLT